MYFGKLSPTNWKNLNDLQTILDDQDSLTRLFKARIAMFPRALRRNMSVWRHSKSPKQCLTFSAPITHKIWNLNPIFHVSIWKEPSENCKAFRDLGNLPANSLKFDEDLRKLPIITKDLWKCPSQSETYLASIGINTSCIEGEITINLHSVVGWAFVWVDPVIT